MAIRIFDHAPFVFQCIELFRRPTPDFLLWAADFLLKAPQHLDGLGNNQYNIKKGNRFAYNTLKTTGYWRTGMYAIEQFQHLNKPEAMIITQHSRKRFAERGISVDDIQFAFKTGEIIEQYPDDTPFPSCLILGHSGERVLHTVASIDDDVIYIITAYAPAPEKWEADWRTRKERTK